jgi:hypothetical protein
MGVEHLPGADLLLDHVETGLFEVHGAVHAMVLGKIRSGGRF